MTDFLWDIATSDPVLMGIAGVLLVALFIGFVPLVKWLPVIGPYVRVAKLAAFLLVLLLGFLCGFRVSDKRAETRELRTKLAVSEMDREAAEEAAATADNDRKEFAKQAEADQQRIADYAAELAKRPNGACILTPDDFDGVSKRIGG